MKKNKIIIGAIFSVFIVICTPVFATLLHGKNRISNNIAMNPIKIDQKELLFQVILHITNNKDIKKILNSEFEIYKESNFIQNLKLPFVDTPQIIKRKFLNDANILGNILIKILSLSRMHPIIEYYRVYNQKRQEKITSIIEKNDKLKREIIQLSNSNCDCESVSGIINWPFPVICSILLVLEIFSFFLIWYLHIGNNLFIIVATLGEMLNCPGMS